MDTQQEVRLWACGGVQEKEKLVRALAAIPAPFVPLWLSISPSAVSKQIDRTVQQKPINWGRIRDFPSLARFWSILMVVSLRVCPCFQSSHRRMSRESSTKDAATSSPPSPSHPPFPPQPPHACLQCRQPALKLVQCAQCRSVNYCSKGQTRKR